MTRLKPLPWQREFAEPVSPPWAYPARRAAALVLHAASATLARLARRLAVPRATVRTAARPPVIEFHAEAGAPEGALYLDGQLVGWLSGVKRL